MRISHTTAALALFATLLMSQTAGATDFRAMSFGDSCQKVTALEAARGLTPLDEQLPSGYQFAFRGREFDRDVVVGYSCRDGALFRGAYIMPARDEADASALYTKLKKDLTRALGAPSYDFASSAHREKMRSVGATLSRADTEVAFWNGKRSEAHLSVGQPSGARGWRVSLSYTAE